MGNEKTKFTEQEILNYSTDDTVAPPLLQVGSRVWTGSSWVKLSGDSSGYLNVNIVSGAGGTQYADGDARGTATGTLAMGDDGTNIQSVKVDSSGVLAIQDNSGSITVDQPTGTNLHTVVDSGAITETNSASIKTAVETIDNAISGTEMQVDVVAPLPAGTNNIGDVDVVSSVLPSGASTLAEQQTQTTHLASIAGEDFATQTTLSAINAKLVTGTDIGDVTINNASGGSAVNIQDGGNTITVDGTVGVTGVSTLAEQQTQTTALQLIDDTVATLGTTTYTEAATKGLTIGAVRRDANTSLVDTTNEIAPLQVNATGELKTAVIQALPAGTNNIGDVDIVSGTITTVTTCNLAAETTKVIGTVRVASGGIASGSLASGSIASGAIASGAIASGAIAAGAITAGATSIATTEDTASAANDHLVKVAQIRLDTPVSGANLSNSGDYTQFIADSFGKTWTAGTYPEDLAHVAGEPINGNGVRRIDTAASSAGSSGDWATMDASAEGAVWSTLTPTTTSGLSVANFNSGDTYTALTNSAQVIKASAGNLYGYYIYNPNASVAYVMIYNIAAASVTVGTSTALMVFAVPASSGSNLMFPYPITFSNAGWSIACATTGGGNTAPGTALEVMIWYK